MILGDGILKRICLERRRKNGELLVELWFSKGVTARNQELKTHDERCLYGTKGQLLALANQIANDSYPATDRRGMHGDCDEVTDARSCPRGAAGSVIPMGK